MTYASLETMVERFGSDELTQRTDRAGTGEMDVQVLDRALADADAEVHGYLAVRYALPLVGVPTALARVAADIARYRLYDDGVPETVRKRYEDAVALLKRIANGDVKLVLDGDGQGGTGTETGGAQVLPEVVPASGASANAVHMRAPAKRFGPDQLRGY